VDYFEADTSVYARNETKMLLDWWNEWVLYNSCVLHFEVLLSPYSQIFPDAAPSRAKQLGRNAIATSTHLLMERRRADQTQGNLPEVPDLVA
jgi:hypothetical protein